MKKNENLADFRRFSKQLLSYTKNHWRNSRENKVLALNKRLKRYFKGLKPATIRRKLYMLSIIENFFVMHEQSFLLATSELSLSDINNFLNEMESKLSNSVRSVLRDEIRWFLSKSKCLKKIERRSGKKFNIGVKWINKKATRQSIILADQEIYRIIMKLKTNESKMFYEFLYYTASRFSDGYGLMANDLYINKAGRCIARVYDKKRSMYKYATLPVELFNALKRHIEDNSLKKNRASMVFKQAKSTLTRHLTNSLIEVFGKQQLDNYRNQYNVSTHIFRVSRAHNLHFENGLSPRSIMKITNHSNLKTLSESYMREQTMDEIYKDLEKVRDSSMSRNPSLVNKLYHDEKNANE